MLFQSKPDAKPDTFKSITAAGCDYTTPAEHSRMNASGRLIDAVQMDGLATGALNLNAFHRVSFAIKRNGRSFFGGGFWLRMKFDFR